METYVLNVGEDKRRGISWHAHKHSLVSRVAEHCQATHEHMSNVDINEQARSQTQAHELMGSLTRCGDAQKESKKQNVIQVFHPIQSVKSTNKVILRYTHTTSSPVLQRWRR